MGFLLNEPITSLTDIFLSALAFLFFFSLKKTSVSEWTNKWAYFFLLFAISTLIGSLAHGLRSYYTEPQFQIIWLTMNCLGLLSSHFSIIASVIYCNFEPKTKQNIILITTLLTFLFIGLCILRNNFVLVKIYAGVGLLFLLVAHLIKINSFKKGNRYLIFSVLCALITLLIHSTKFSLSIWFNYKDISHVIMMISLYLIYTGVRLHPISQEA